MLFYICVCVRMYVCGGVCMLVCCRTEYMPVEARGGCWVFSSNLLALFLFVMASPPFFHVFLYVYEKCILIIFPIIFSYPYFEPLPNKAPFYFHITHLCMYVCKHSCVHVLFLPQRTPLGSWDKDSHWPGADQLREGGWQQALLFLPPSALTGVDLCT